MAKATTVEKPEAPPAEAEEFEAILPEAVEDRAAAPEDREAEPEPEAVPKPEVPAPKAKAEQPPKPKKPQAKAQPAAEEIVEAEPEAEPQPKKAEPLSPAAREERAKRKMYARKWEAAITERDAALREIDRLKGRPATADERQYLADLRKQADEADSMGKLFELNLQEMDRRERLVAQRLAEMEYTQRVALSQINARILHKDYDEVLQKSGIYAAIHVDGQGNWADPEIGRRVYFTRDGKLRADPAEEAYQLAVGRLEYEAGLKEEREEGGEEQVPPKKPALKVVPKGAAKGEPEEEEAEGERTAEAERRGAQKVIDKVVENANRPKGIRNLRSAGTPATARFTRAQLDALMEHDPQGYQRLVKTNPELERFHLG